MVMMMMMVMMTMITYADDDAEDDGAGVNGGGGGNGFELLDANDFGDACEDRWEEQASLMLDLRSMITHHACPPAGLGAKNAGVGSKLHGFIHQNQIESASGQEATEWLRIATSLTADTSVEILMPRLPQNYRAQNLFLHPQGGPST
eukprot:7577231-Karenia_brevis.AAC.1